MKTTHGQSDCQGRSGARRGFTLVEMLVATGLVMLIMLLFTQIYSSAIGMMTGQRALANNDQKARILSTVLRGDLQNMSYRQPAFPYGNVQGIVPMVAGDEPIIDPVNQRGYFYYSENDPNSDTDDVLQFTTLIKSGQRGDAVVNRNKRPYTGRAYNGTATLTNQPDFDDGVNDNQGQSRAAEICYFVRGGNLYRRVLLLRDPLLNDPPMDPQPTANNGVRVFNGDSSPTYSGSGSFYNDFDYAATRRNDATGTYPWFHSIDSLDNSHGVANLPIAYSSLRFGFGPPGATPGTNIGLPIEYAASTFIGRPTLEETSNANFTWPGQASPEIYSSLSVGTDGVLTGFGGGSRVGEDLLLTNVEAFDIKLHDPGVNDTGMTMGSYVDIGGPTSNYYGTSANTNYHTAVNPPTPAYSANIYDTWHPAMSLQAANFPPPFRIVHSPAGVRWQRATAATLGTIAFPLAGEDLNANGVLDGSEDVNGNGNLDVPGTRASNSLRAVVIQTGTSGALEPLWALTPGATVNDGTIVWKIEDNRIGLKGLHITVRYRDVSSNASRQVTIDHSFVE